MNRSAGPPHSPAPQPPAAPSLAPPGAPGAPRTCPPFSAGRLRRQIAVDALVPWVAWIGFVLLLFSNVWAGDAPWANTAQMVLMMAILGLWFWTSTASMRVAQMLSPITAMIHDDPSAAEAAIAQSLRRRPLQRAIRLSLYHRLALLRHRQGRFPEAAAICTELLNYHLRSLRALRSNLLLIMVESRLEFGDLGGAYAGLMELHALPLGLGEMLQRTALQTRYEVASGHYVAALTDLRRKVQMAELLPATQCGMLHGLWATAAERAGRPAVAAWLRQRAELLLPPEQLPLA